MSGSLDLILVGGGLASGLVALRLKTTRPDVTFLVLERGTTLGGEHTWSFHGTDIDDKAHDLIRPMVAKSWSGHSVKFPGYERDLLGSYHSIRSEKFHEALYPVLHSHVLFGAHALELKPTEVRLSDGRSLKAKCVIDARGFSRILPDTCGWQKFFGMDVTLEKPHGLSGPILMDASCAQLDGYRFIYCLPWSERSLLIEDTRYSDTSAVDVEGSRLEIRRYAAEKGWRIESEDREEIGSLPIPLRRSFQESDGSGAPTIGVRSGLFHPTTGYSLPDAIGAAEVISRLPDFAPARVKAATLDRARRADADRGFFRFLNRMLFEGAEPSERYRVLQRFYTLPEPTIARFYRSSLTFVDYARILVGRPPIPVSRALSCLLDPGTGTRQGLRFFSGMTCSEVMK